jgi:4-amino-4-deoxy-L-arabinose transferase-like glycosyltransferase
MHKSTPALVCFITLVYVGLAIAHALTMRPWCDEGWFSNPAENLLSTGRMETSVLDTTASWRQVNLQGIDRHTYWVMPLYLLAQAAWYRITDFSLVSMRLLSVLWGLVALLSWYVILKRLSGSTTVVLLALALLAVDFQFLLTAVNGRMDMMTFALETAALAAYLSLRERRFAAAVLVSQTLAAAGLFTHPMGALGVVGLAFVSLYCDRKRVRFVHIATAALPYIVGAAGWGLYILESPSDFVAQFSSNASGRLGLLTEPLAALRREIVIRYLTSYGLAPGLPAPGRLKGIILAIYIAGVLVAFATRSIRNDRLLRILLILAAWNALGVTLLDSYGIGWYLIYIIPFAIVLLSISVNHLWSSRRVPPTAIALALTLLIAIQFVVSASRVAKNDRRDFLSAAGFLRNRLDGYRLVMASAEFGIPFRFDRRMLDDFRLGYRSRKTPDLIVMDSPRYCLWSELLRDQDPGNYRYIHNLLSSYRVVYNHGAYRMYERPALRATESPEEHR